MNELTVDYLLNLPEDMKEMLKAETDFEKKVILFEQLVKEKRDAERVG